ncbi:hypothetical protein LFM09_02750 [Lentzea alba]|uniref:NACHT domain-containing protein n=1 Tax=Lentzea alba TaxID=2714351 RepID=UPI0039BF979F
MHNEVHRSTVHGHVVQANEIGELHLHGTEKQHPPLTSWQDRPELTEQLEDLLHVQREAAETLPYRLLGVKQPELTRVYVQQSVRGTGQQDRPVPIGEALARGKHLLITGEPGAGKSTLGQMYVQRLATEWLETSADPPTSEPVMPLRIPAKALADDLPWSELLANAVRDRRLNATLKPELFAKRALGARWLVFVDGLDEIAEPERRDRVIDALVSRMRRGSDHRLVITTRPLPPDELQKLHGQDIDLFTIQPFGPVELQDFASAWFRAQNPTNSKDRAAEFVSQVHDGRLRELVRNPLLATIAAIANTLEPHRKLPHNRADLYERFMGYLLDDRASGRTTLAELRKAHADDPQRVEQIEWLYERRQELVEHLAVQRLESERPLLEIASDWVTSLKAHAEDVLAVLASTGVFVHGTGGLKFLHHSFAEFLTARVRSARIPADFPNLDEWVELGTQPARETSVLFTFALWGRKPGHDLDLVIERLLEGGVKHALLAGRLLAEDVAITPERAAEVVDRLVKLMLANGVREVPWPEARNIGRVLAGLDNESIAHLLVPRLHTMRDNDDLPSVVRIGCAVALGHLVSPEQAVTWLQEYADVRHSDALSAIASGLAEIVPNGADLAEELVLRLVKTTDSYSLHLYAMDTLRFDVERRESARHVLRDVVRRLRSDRSIRQGSPHVPHSGALANTSPYSWHTLCHQASVLGCQEEVVWVAQQILAQSSVDHDNFRSAVGALLAHDREAVVDSLVARARSLTPEHVLIVAEHLTGDVMIELARSVLTRPSADNDQFVRACELLGPYEPGEVLELVLERNSLRPADPIRLAEPLMLSDQELEDLVGRAGVFRVDGERSFLPLVTDLLTVGLDAYQVYSEVVDGLPAQRAAAAAALFQAGHSDEAGQLAGSLLTEPLDAMSAAVCLDGMITKKVPKQAQKLFDHLLVVVGQHDPAVARRFAPVLHRVGRSEKAAEVALDAFLRSLGGQEVDDCVATVLEVSGSALAGVIVQKVRESNLNVWQRMDIADVFVNDGLLDHAVMLWLDVVRSHDPEVAKGVEAADKLVKVGERAKAIEAASYNRALTAWLEA